MAVRGRIDTGVGVGGWRPDGGAGEVARVQRLAGCVGDWTFEEKTRDFPTAPEETVRGTWHARWLGDQIEWRARFSAGGRDVTLVEVEGWDPVRKLEYGSWFLSSGTRGSFTGSWSGTTLVADGSSVSAEGKPGRDRCSFSYASDFSAVDYRCESGEKGKTWVSRTGRAVKVVPSVTTAMGTGELLGIHEVVLKPGVEPAELERFAAEEFEPVVRDLFPGIRVRVYKGERGRAPGSYLVVLRDLLAPRARLLLPPATARGCPRPRRPSRRPAGPLREGLEPPGPADHGPRLYGLLRDRPEVGGATHQPSEGANHDDIPSGDPSRDVALALALLTPSVARAQTAPKWAEDLLKTWYERHNAADAAGVAALTPRTPCSRSSRGGPHSRKTWLPNSRRTR